MRELRSKFDLANDRLSWLIGGMICAAALLNGCARPTSSIPGQDSAPKHIPTHLDKVPNATPKVEPLSRYGNRFKKNSTNTYVALKKRYSVMPTSRGYAAHGKASWYGTKFQGRRTSSGEPYDMFAMTAAHKTLPLPTYARVTNLDNGKSVIVKVNDRGPFHNDRLIDLSYVAAHKLGILGKGTGQVRVESVDPRDHHGQVPGEKRNFFGRRPHCSPTPHSAETLAAGTITTMAVGTKTAGTRMAGGNIAGKTTPIDNESASIAKETANIANMTTTKPQLYLQLGAFNQQERAESFIKEVSKLSKLQASMITQQKNKQALFKVRLGPFSNQQQVTEATKVLAEANLPAPIMVKGP